MKVDPQRPVQVKVVGVTGASLMVHEQFGDKGIPLVQIQTVQMPPPPEVGTAVGAFKNKEYAKALAAARVVYDKYKGLPGYNPRGTQGCRRTGRRRWVRSSAIFISHKGTSPKREAAYEDFGKAYPGNGSADLGRARVAVAKKDFDTAKKTAEPLCEQALKQKNVVDAEGQIYGQAFLVLGQIKEAQGDYQGALEDYLRTVTLFYHDHHRDRSRPRAGRCASKDARRLRPLIPLPICRSL